MERFVLWHRIMPPAFEAEETTAAAGQWARYVTNEIEAAGGEVVSSLAGTVVAVFELRELKPLINLALRLLSEAEGQPVPAGGLPIAFGVATGEVERARDDAGNVTGSGIAIDRAQLLANQACAGEAVLDKRLPRGFDPCRPAEAPAADGCGVIPCHSLTRVLADEAPTAHVREKLALFIQVRQDKHALRLCIRTNGWRRDTHF